VVCNIDVVNPNISTKAALKSCSEHIKRKVGAADLDGLQAANRGQGPEKAAVMLEEP